MFKFRSKKSMKREGGKNNKKALREPLRGQEVIAAHLFTISTFKNFLICGVLNADHCDIL